MDVFYMFPLFSAGEKRPFESFLPLDIPEEQPPLKKKAKASPLVLASSLLFAQRTEFDLSGFLLRIPKTQDKFFCRQIDALADLLLDEGGSLCLQNLSDLKEIILKQGLPESLKEYQEEILRRLSNLEKSSYFQQQLPHFEKNELHSYFTMIVYHFVPESEHHLTSRCIHRAFLTAFLFPIRQFNGGYCFAVAALRMFINRHPDLVHKTVIKILTTGEVQTKYLPSPINIGAHIDPETEWQSEHPLVDLLLKCLILGSKNFCLRKGENTIVCPLSSKAILLSYIRDGIKDIISRKLNLHSQAEVFSNLVWNRLAYSFSFCQHSKVAAVSYADYLAPSVLWSDSWLYFSNLPQLEQFFWKPLLKEVQHGFKEVYSYFKSRLSLLGELSKGALEAVWLSDHNSEQSYPEELSDSLLIEMEGGYGCRAIAAVFEYEYEEESLSLSEKNSSSHLNGIKSSYVLAYSNDHEFNLYPNKIQEIPYNKIKQSTEKFLSCNLSLEKKKLYLKELKISPSKGEKKKNLKQLLELKKTSNAFQKVTRLADSIPTAEFMLKGLVPVLSELGLNETDQEEFLVRLPENVHETKSRSIAEWAGLLYKHLQKQFPRQKITTAICNAMGLPLQFHVGDTNYNSSSVNGSLYLTSNLQGGVKFHPEGIASETGIRVAVSPEKRSRNKS